MVTLATMSHGFNVSVNISENCDFQSHFDPFYIILKPFEWKSMR